jgi:hypothetical protein
LPERPNGSRKAWRSNEPAAAGVGVTELPRHGRTVPAVADRLDTDEQLVTDVLTADSSHNTSCC